MVSKGPLSDPETAQPDKRLFGVWKPVAAEWKERENELLLIGRSSLRHSPPGLMSVVTIRNEKDNYIRVHEPLDFLTTSLDGQWYVNYASWEKGRQQQWDKSRVPPYFIGKYTVEGDRLTFSMMETDAVEREILAGHLKGTVQLVGLLKIKTVEIASTSQELCRYLQNGGDKLLFPPEAKKLVLQRIH
jgi:hypothetical protein